MALAHPILLSWGKIRSRVVEMHERIHAELGHTNWCVYGVPRGGVPVALMLGGSDRVVNDPVNANVIVDDVIDSGKTKAEYEARYPEARFFSLYDKRPEAADHGAWLVFPWEAEDEATGPTDAVVRLLEFIQEDPNREGLLDTPKRVVKALGEMTAGYHQDPKEILSTTFESDYDEIVSVKGIPFNSMCEHHMLPFQGVAHVAYLPNEGGRVVGLSKIPRLVHCFAKRLQIQEQLTQQIAKAIETHLEPAGVAVILEAHHSCMSMRGIQSAGQMKTSCMLGAFRDEPEARAEVLSLLGS